MLDGERVLSYRLDIPSLIYRSYRFQLLGRRRLTNILKIDNRTKIPSTTAVYTYRTLARRLTITGNSIRRISRINNLISNRIYLVFNALLIYRLIKYKSRRLSRPQESSQRLQLRLRMLIIVLYRLYKLLGKTEAIIIEEGTAD